MENGFQPQSWLSLVKNPLSIIALFISMIYGMSALLLGQSVEHLTHHNQTVLTWFLATFPVLTLGLFGYLVIFHHTKFYSPTDFKDEANFVNLSSFRVGARIQKEVDQGAIPPEAAAGPSEAPSPNAPAEPPSPDAPARKTIFTQDAAATDHPPKANDEPPSPSLATTELQDSQEINTAHSGDATAIISDSAQRASATLTSFIVAESLVMQEMQHEYQAPVSRSVAVSVEGRRIEVDGLIQTKNGPVVIDVKSVRPTNVSAKLREIGDIIVRLQAVSSRATVVIALVLHDVVFSKRHLAELEYLRSQYPRASIRLYSYSELRAKYGLPKL